MLEFTFVQNYYVQDPLYALTLDGFHIGTIEYNGKCWAVQYVNHPYLLTASDFMRIANKLTEINDSLRAQRWFK